MKHRSPIVVALLAIFVPFYMLYWYIVTASEMRARGASLPTTWLIIVPFVNFWWLYKFGQSVEQVTNGKTSGILAFLALLLIGAIGAAIIQDSFNGVSNTSSPASPIGAAPTDSMGTPPSGPSADPTAPVAAPTPSFIPPATAAPAVPEQAAAPSTPSQPPTGPVSS